MQVNEDGQLHCLRCYPNQPNELKICGHIQSVMMSSDFYKPPPPKKYTTSDDANMILSIANQLRSPDNPNNILWHNFYKSNAVKHLVSKMTNPNSRTKQHVMQKYTYYMTCASNARKGNANTDTEE